MKIDSPVIHSFVETMNAQDAKRFGSLFTADAEVLDEGHTHRGPAAIEDWIVEAWRQTEPKLAPQSVTGEFPDLVLHAEVSGNFPGSPLVLRHHFILEGDKIAKLQITV